MKAKKEAGKAAHGTGVVQFCFKLIRDGKSNDYVLAAVHKKFPTSKLKIGGVGWCRNKLRQMGEKIPHQRDLTAKAKKAA